MDHRDTFAATLELDCLCPTLADEPAGVAHGIIDRNVVAHPGHITDDQGTRLSSGNSSSVVNHHIDVDGQSVIVAKDDVGD